LTGRKIDKGNQQEIINVLKKGDEGENAGKAQNGDSEY